MSAPDLRLGADPHPTQEQLDAVAAVLVRTHNTSIAYSINSVAAEARLLNQELLANLSDDELCRMVQALYGWHYAIAKAEIEKSGRRLQ